MSDNLYIASTKTSLSQSSLSGMSHLSDDPGSPLLYHNRQFSAQTHGFSKRNCNNWVKEGEPLAFCDKKRPMHLQHKSDIPHLKHSVRSKNNRPCMSRMAYSNHPPLGGPRVVTQSDGKSKYERSIDNTGDHSTPIIKIIVYVLKDMFKRRPCVRRTGKACGCRRCRRKQTFKVL